MEKFVIERYRRKKELFNVLFKSDRDLDNGLIYRVLVLISKYYGDYIVSEESLEGKEFKVHWKDYIIEDYDLFEKNDLKFFSVDIDAFFYYQKEKELIKLKIDSGLGIYAGLASDNIEFGVDVYANLFTDFDYIWSMGFKKGILKVDNSKAAKKNRTILKSFLMDLERVLNGEIIEYSSQLFDNKFIYKYGFKENVDYSYEPYIRALLKT